MIREVLPRFERPLNIAAANKARKSCEFWHRQAGDPTVWLRTEAVALEFRC
jgi:hypothetical protein